MSDKLPTKKPSSGDVQAFLNKATVAKVKARQPGARLLFALDATASRQPTWDTACQLQGDMFSAVKNLSGLSIQLCYFRGFREFHNFPWLEDSASLQREMSKVQCRAGHTQLEQVLRHARAEQKSASLKAVVFVGDAFEESLDRVCGIAGELGLLRLPVFMFQEGGDPTASRAFAEIARLSGGVHLKFNQNSAAQLRDLLTAVAAYAAGGRPALQSQAPSRLRDAMLKQLPGPR